MSNKPGWICCSTCAERLLRYATPACETWLRGFRDGDGKDGEG